MRSILTVAVIAVGIASVVGIQTALSIISSRVSESFGKMGSSSFVIESVQGKTPVSLEDAVGFKNIFNDEALVSVVNVCSSTAYISFKSLITDPVVSVVASDDNYLSYQMGSVENGRMISSQDVSSASRVAVIGNNVKRKLFKDENPVGSIVSVGGVKFEVVGEIKRQGSMFGTGLDNMVVIPYTAARNESMISEASFVAVMPYSTISDCKMNADYVMNQVRRAETADFRISSSDSVQNELEKISDKLSLATLIIGIIAIVGAAISVMNIMLVSVKERKMEIGVKKALGAPSSSISGEFFAESVLLGWYGAVAGILNGVLLGKIAAIAMEAEMSFPWKWSFLSIAICLVVSVLSAWIPAGIAASSSPVDSLRDNSI